MTDFSRSRVRRPIGRVAAPLALLAGIACAGAGPSSGGAAAPSPESTVPVLHPGSDLLSIAHLSVPSRSRTRYLVRRGADTVERTMSELTHSRQAVDPDALRLTWETLGARRDSDSLDVDARTFAPLRETLRVGRRQYQLAYDGARVTRSVTIPDSAARSDELSVPGAFFFNQLDAVVSSLPLRSGFSAIVPLYSEIDGKLEMDSVSVLGQAPDGAWRVRFADPVIVSTYLLGPDRNIRALETRNRAHPEMLLRRVPVPE